MITGRALVQTTRHFFPDLNVWLSRLPDTRVQKACTYDRRFLAWWGIHLYLLQLGSRRQLDFELRDGGPSVLANFNRLAETTQTTLPVHDTLDHFVGHVKLAGWLRLRNQMVQDVRPLAAPRERGERDRRTRRSPRIAARDRPAGWRGVAMIRTDVKWVP